MGNVFCGSDPCATLECPPQAKRPVVQTTRTTITLFKRFEVQRTIGKGASGKVYAVICPKTQASLALKVIRKSTPHGRQRYQNEVSILSDLEHPHIVKFDGAWEDRQRFGITTRLCVGGTLVARVKAGAHYSERVAALLLRDIVSAIAYAHERDIVHRDIKLRNIVFETNCDQSRPVIIDWGEACQVDDDEMFNDLVGTPVYLSPEMSRCRTGWELKKSDMWAIGVTAYVMLIGAPPFMGQTARECFRRVRREKLTFASPISRSAKTFIRACMKKSTKARATAKEALEFDFLKNAEKQSDIAIGMFMNHRLAEFTKATDLQQLLINIQVQLMNKEDQRALRNLFADITSRCSRSDEDSSEICPEELAEYLKNVNPYYCDEDALDRANKIISATGQKNLNAESMAQSRVAQKMTQETHIRDIFTFLDQEENGYVRSADIKRVASYSLKRQLSDEETEMIDTSFVSHFGQERVPENDFVLTLTMRPRVNSHDFNAHFDITPRTDMPQL